MGKCAVKICKSQSEKNNKGSGVTFHKDPTPVCVCHDHESDDIDYSSDEVEASDDDVSPTVRVKRSDDDSQYTNDDYADWGYDDEDVAAQNEDEKSEYARHTRMHGKRQGDIKGIMTSWVRMPTSSEKDVMITIPKMRGWQCGKDKTRLITLDPKGKLGGREYKIVVDQMEQTKVAQRTGDFKKYNIIKIEKVVNGCFWKKYKKRQEAIRNENKYANEQMLFHGSGKIKELTEHGFDERYANTNGMFGAGVYFAKNSSKSNQYAFGVVAPCPTHNVLYCDICIRQMMLCRVTLGKMKDETRANKRSHAPPGHHSVRGVPSITGSLSSEEYIVYRGEQVYPEYIITYKIVNN